MNQIDFCQDLLPLKDKIYRLALRITLNRQEAEDLTQDTLLRAWDKRVELCAVQSLEAYCLTIVRRLALDRLALKELDRVEAENPDRAESPEFAPLRNKRATCSAAIDAIRFAQVNENKRAVAVSNTTDLERKWRIKHGLQTLADEAFAKQEAAKTNAAAQASSSASAATNAPAAKKPPPAASYDVRLKEALAEVRKGDYATADRLLDGLEEERPDDLNLLLIRSAAQVGVGSLFAARRTLERAMKAHPKSYLPCYNLANLALRLNENLDVARDYYEQGRALGGPRNEALERRLNTK